jgi:mannose-1-phosphate guanylyltransferase/mannose-6-phosphate isomerase
MVFPVVLCGGVGSRLWPLSRDTHPKPFITLADGESLLQKAFLRGAEQAHVSEIVTVTNRDLFFKIEDQYRQINQGNIGTSYILEPFGRNTAAAIASAALHLQKAHGDQAIMLVLAADHVISKPDQFMAAVEKAATLASQGRLVTFGIRPTGPETGYGYIEAEDDKVLRFVEKPNFEAAVNYVTSGRFFWNSGMFCFRVADILQAMRKYCPDVLTGVEECLHSSRSSTSKGFVEIELDADTFLKVPDISIDYAVMEKADNVSVVACDIGWDDVGSWASFSKTVGEDDNGNAVEGIAILHDVQNSYIRSESRLIAAVGVNDLVVIDTDDALLVSTKSRVQDVKHIYNSLKQDGHDLHKIHRTVQRPWGTYTILDEGDSFKAKRIVVKPGGVLSLQMHYKRSEHWTVVSGIATVINGDEVLTLHPNQSTYIPVGNKHRLQNEGSEDVVLIEVQCGNYFGEDDIVRFQDIYGRA